MTLPREAWPRLKEAFEGARALAVDARPAYLVEVCNGDEALRREVELLLAHGDQAASFLETPAMQFDDSLVARSLEGQCIGPYQVLALIGTGGMGEVYSARDTKLNRVVALKVLHERFALDPDRVARFRREATARRASSVGAAAHSVRMVSMAGFSGQPNQALRPIAAWANRLIGLAAELPPL